MVYYVHDTRTGEYKYFKNIRGAKRSKYFRNIPEKNRITTNNRLLPIGTIKKGDKIEKILRKKSKRSYQPIRRKSYATHKVFVRYGSAQFRCYILAGTHSGGSEGKTLDHRTVHTINREFNDTLPGVYNDLENILAEIHENFYSDHKVVAVSKIWYDYKLKNRNFQYRHNKPRFAAKKKVFFTKKKGAKI